MAERWTKLMSAQAGLDILPTDDGATITPKNKLVYDNAVFGDDFELEPQILEDCEWTLTVEDKTVSCVCVQSLQKDKSGNANTYYIDSETPIRCPIAVGDTVRIQLRAEWTDKRKTKNYEQRIIDGTFTIPETMQTMGAPGYQIYVPYLKTLCYLNVGNIIQKATGSVQLEILSFNCVLLGTL